MVKTGTEITESILTAGFTAVLRTDGIAQFNLHPAAGKETSVDDIKQMADAMFRLGKGQLIPALLFIDSDSDIDPEARIYAASEEALKYTKANAIVINSVLNRMAANFYIRFSKPVRPTKMFNSEANAVLWLLSIS